MKQDEKNRRCFEFILFAFFQSIFFFLFILFDIKVEYYMVKSGKLDCLAATYLLCSPMESNT